MSRIEALLRQYPAASDIERMACETCGRRYAALCKRYKWKAKCARLRMYESQYYPRRP
jgi:hypothetical protein